LSETAHSALRAGDGRKGHEVRHTGLLLVYSLAAAMTAQPPDARVEAIRYTSQIDAPMKLSARVAYPPAGKDLPILAVMHGLRENASSISDSALVRLATAYGDVFVVAVEMRGRGDSEGSPDVGGREIQDIVDAVRFVLDHYPGLTDPEQIHVVGYSGGGANALSCAARYPDMFNTATSFFGISDYGSDSRAGWYASATPARQSFLRRWIGGSPFEQPDRYRARAAVAAITNYSGGILRLFHDRQDNAVAVDQSKQVAEVMAAAGLANCRLSVTGPGDDPRWIHGAPNGKAGVIGAEESFMLDIGGKRVRAWSVPAAGDLKVAGYLETRRFGLWLGDGTAGFARLHYDTAAAVFNIAKESGPDAWALTIKGRRPGSKLTVTVNGKRYTRPADRAGTIAIRKGSSAKK